VGWFLPTLIAFLVSRATAWDGAAAAIVGTAITAAIATVGMTTWGRAFSIGHGRLLSM
jgi:hypothetical protein